MAINDYLEQARKGIENEKAQKLNSLVNSLRQGKIAAYNAEADKSRDNEVGDLRASYDKAVQELRAKFDTNKTQIVERFEEDKKAYADRLIEQETAELTYSYDRKLEQLQTMIKE